MKANKEMGGFLPIEICERDEYYKSNVCKLNSARNAIILAMHDGNYKKLYLPVYMCPSVSDTLDKYEINYELYNIDNALLPNFSKELSKEECILIVNYFGIISTKTMKRLVSYYKNVIIDNTQAFYSVPNYTVYNIYSCRKFFGVSDGAYLIKENINQYRLKQDVSSKRAHFLLESLEVGTNEVYSDFIRSEEDINDSEICAMSKLTEKILKGIDYQKINDIRLTNFRYLNNKLGNYNELKFGKIEYAPMVYPLLIDGTDLREYLIKNHIYISQWWNACIKNKNSNFFERKLSNDLLPLPIDQRYSIQDMQHLVRILLCKLENRL